MGRFPRLFVVEEYSSSYSADSADLSSRSSYQELMIPQHDTGNEKLDLETNVVFEV